MLNTRISLFLTQIRRFLKLDIALSIQQVAPWPDSQPFVSVVIPCYNHGQYVAEAVQSILHQTWQDVEVIIVNDGSSEEETLNILRDFTHPKTRVMHLPKNIGLPAARNVGIAEAHGRYICCLDADDKLQPTYLEKAITTMEVNAGLSFVGAWTQVFGIENRVWYPSQFDPDQIIYFNQFNSLAVFRRSAWEKIGGFFEEMREGFEDWEFWVRMTGHGYRGHQITGKLIHVRRLGYSFALRAADKKNDLFEQIKSNNAGIYANPKSVIKKIKRSYSDVYSAAPFVNLNDRRNYLQMDMQPKMVVSDLNSEATIVALKNQNTHLPLIWVAKRALDEKATDLLYQTTPFVYILPNFLPWYAHNEFIQNLMKIWKIQLTQKLKE